MKKLLATTAVALSVVAGGAFAAKEIPIQYNTVPECRAAYSDGSRLNPQELSEFQICWLNVFKQDEQSGTLGSFYWTRVNDQIVSSPVNNLIINGTDNYIAMVEQSILDQALADLEAQKAELEEAKADVEATNAKLIAEQERVIAQVEEINQLQTDLKDKQDEVDLLERLLNATDFDLETEFNLRKDLEVKVEELNSQVSDLESQLSSKQEALEAEIAKAITQEQTILNLNADVQAKQLEINAHLETIAQQGLDWDAEVEALTKERNDLQTELQAAEDLAEGRIIFGTEVESNSDFVIHLNNGKTMIFDISSSYDNGFLDGKDSVDVEFIYNDGFTAGEDSVDTDSIYNDGYNEGKTKANSDSLAREALKDVIIADQLVDIDMLEDELKVINSNIDAIKAAADSGDFSLVPAYDPDTPSEPILTRTSTGEELFVESVEIIDNNLYAKVVTESGEVIYDAFFAGHKLSLNSNTIEELIALNEKVLVKLEPSTPDYDNRVLQDVNYDNNTANVESIYNWSDKDNRISTTVSINLTDDLQTIANKVEEFVRIETEKAYDRGYDDGYKDGYTDGFVDGVNSVKSL